MLFVFFRNHRPVSTQVPSVPRSTRPEHIPSMYRPFEHRSQPILRNRTEHSTDTHNNNVHYSSYRRPLQQPPPPPPVAPPLPISPVSVPPLQLPIPVPAPQPLAMTASQSRHIYHPQDHRHFVLETPAVSSSRRQSSQTTPARSYTSQTSNHHQRTGIPFESVTSRAPIYHRSSMTTHMHQRAPPPASSQTATSFLTDLLHRVIDAHAASYSDNHVHHYHHHHPPSASIDLIAYAWMSPSQDVFSLPAAFSIHFGVRKSSFSFKKNIFN